ncbi:hypothetical protein ACEWY4_014540 [Coilia grayii]|uniref:RING-type domain-containing protein n=1 Tax=Coilia grayii TaxID=363190 RepID=A0ABD1JSM9_9TELE
MDESALLDLLECPVCLERLDATAKVLPCQHTFCRRCLLGIVGSRGELRCPECRTLVESGVDELPSNILLVRLLDGIKQRPRRPGPGPGAGGGGGGSGGPATGGCTANGTAAVLIRAQATAAQREPGAPGAQPQRVQAKSTPVRQEGENNKDVNSGCLFLDNCHDNSCFCFLFDSSLGHMSLLAEKQEPP